MAASPAVRERLRKMRQKYGLGEYKKGSKKRRSTVRGATMAKKRKSRRKSSNMFGGGIMGMLKPALIGTGGGLVVGMAQKKIPQIQSIPFAQGLGGAAACLLLGQTAPVKLAIGGVSGQFVAPIANDTIASVTGIRVY